MNYLDLEILHEDNHLILINKKVGDLVQGDRTNDIPLSQMVKNYLKKKYNKCGEVFLGVTHRLDRPTSGVVIFAKTSKALRRINQMFRENKIAKKYWAIVKQKPQIKSQRLTHWLKKNSRTNKTTVYNKPTVDTKKAILDFKILKYLDNYTLLEINLQTGRSHQIRSQLAYIGSPIKGDIKYGYERTNRNGGIDLHARMVKFIHPVTKEKILIIARTPDEKIWNDCL